MDEYNSMEELMASIREITKGQKSSSAVDQIKVQRMMLNDDKYKLSIYDHLKGKIGERSPRE